MSSSKGCFNPRNFAACLGFLLFVEIYASSYYKSALTTIERLFSFSSTVTAVLSSGFQIGNLGVMIFVSYFGSLYHRPRMIGIGCLLLAVGFFLMTVPQFVGDRYDYADISTNFSTTSNNSNHILCQSVTDSTSNAVECNDPKNMKTTDHTYIFILIGIMICGIGGAPVSPLGLSYIDDYANKHNSALYIGIVTSIGLIGPAAGFVTGSLILKLWVDIGWVDTTKVTIEPNDPRWVGAWWLGFLIMSVLLLFASIPFWFYPRELEKEEEDKNKQEFSNDFRRIQSSLKAESGGFLHELKKLLCDKRYVLVLSIWITHTWKIAGVSTFAIKYLEVAFGKSASQSSFLIGTINLPMIVVSTIVGSLIIKKWKLEITGIIRLSIFAMSGSILCFIPQLFIGCDSIDVAGVTVPYPNSNFLSDTDLNLNLCNIPCNCEEGLYAPVCASNGVTYKTPCHAGCTEFLSDETGKITEYANCSCVEGYGTIENNTVSLGVCSTSKCEDLVWIVLALKTVASLFGGLNITPMLVLIIRSLQPEQKAFGIGIGFFAFRLFGWIPSPIVFGYLIDNTCLFWSHKQCSSKAYCRVYDNAKYRLNYFGLGILTDVVATILTLVYYYGYARDYAKKGSLQKLKENEADKEANNSEKACKLLSDYEAKNYEEKETTI